MFEYLYSSTSIVTVWGWIDVFLHNHIVIMERILRRNISCLYSIYQIKYVCVRVCMCVCVCVTCTKTWSKYYDMGLKRSISRGEACEIYHAASHQFKHANFIPSSNCTPTMSNLSGFNNSLISAFEMLGL